MRGRIVSVLIVVLMFIVLLGISCNTNSVNINEKEILKNKFYGEWEVVEYLGTVIWLTEENIEYFGAHVK